MGLVELLWFFYFMAMWIAAQPIVARGHHEKSLSSQDRWRWFYDVDEEGHVTDERQSARPHYHGCVPNGQPLQPKTVCKPPDTFLSRDCPFSCSPSSTFLAPLSLESAIIYYRNMPLDKWLFDRFILRFLKFFIETTKGPQQGEVVVREKEKSAILSFSQCDMSAEEVMR